MSAEACICGAAMSERGTCDTHCDTRPEKPAHKTCPHCLNREHHGPISRTRSATIPAAALHERRCRGAEIIQGRKS